MIKPTRIRLKVCGMRDAENIMQVASCQPDYMGFIFYEKSPRFVGTSFQVPDAFPSSIKRVGVFVNEEPQTVLKHVKNLKLDYVQLHGNENQEQCKQFKDAGIGVIKVFSVDDAFNFTTTESYKSCADFFLFDTKGKYHGGNAITFDWSILKNYDQEIPFFLSGGINPENVSGITELKGMNIHALDINSGVEITPGVKDVHKIKLINDIVKTL
ncbi:MAG TPA: phosphoribosylanthranilate isomerase [Cyclobacteriaceae bacterium]|jgi:phosphoribosylanthranilate isomerase|nr:phosphoribosylanthranilate isomerase [Cyclobacteriaceae bacterium]